MADKKGPEVATVIITVDLGCRCCAKKIRKTLCRLQKRFKINSIVFDEKKNTVTVSGPFDPCAFIARLRCMACRVIKDVQIKKPDPPKPPPPQPPTPPPPPPPPPPCLPPCPPPCWPPCTPPCRPPCPPPCSKPCPPPCPPPCPKPCPPQRPHPLPGSHQPCTCNEPSHDCGGCSSCETPRPPIAPPFPPILPWPTPPKCDSGVPCFKIVCESEPSGCSFM